MTTYFVNIREIPLLLIKNGEKTIELRVNKGIFRAVKVGDKLWFSHHTDLLNNIEKNVMFGISHIQERESLAQEYLSLFKVADLSKKYPHEISAGQQQRVAFARALITNPDILLLDEPFGALDKNLKEELHEETKKIFKNKDLSVLLVTHDEEEAKYFSDRIIEFKEDKIFIR